MINGMDRRVLNLSMLALLTPVLMVLAGLASITAPMAAQTPKTSIPVKNLRGLTSPSGSVVAITGDGRVLIAQLGEGIVLDTSGPVPILRAVQTPAPQIVFVEGERPSPGGPGNRVFTLASVPNPASSLKVYLNGLLLTEGEDYTVSGTTVTLNEHYTVIDINAPPGTRDILKVYYRTVNQ